ncbi:MAG TPA: UDP-3-O-(3-hydroxymyristoyl)glucosamine N-acyltransferase [Thiotrichales bacterium]|nr:UDP-3-O-(3-hydroxymyristoyl)glucosamine N-acyltransferase [Thiotrichales bacterium]
MVSQASVGRTLNELAHEVGGRVVGDGSVVIRGVCTLQQGQAGHIAFLANPRYRRFLPDTRAAAVILKEEDLPQCPVPALVVPDPYVAYARIAALLSPLHRATPGVHETAVVAEDAEIDPAASIGPLAVVGEGARIEADVQVGAGSVVGAGVHVGEGTRLVANVTLCDGVRIGRNCLIHPGAVIGADGFGIAKDGERWIKVPQLGSVWIGDNVEIGANTTVDRGALEDTVIEEGAKLDNQIQVAHNVHIGAHTAIAGCVGISGSAHIGRNCMLAGGVGVVGHLEITDNVVVTGMSMVTKSITEPGVYSSGLAAVPNDQWNRIYARMRRLDEMARRLQKLEKKLAALEGGAEPDKEKDS